MRIYCFGINLIFVTVFILYAHVGTEADVEEILAEADALQERGEFFDLAPLACGLQEGWRHLNTRLSSGIQRSRTRSLQTTWNRLGTRKEPADEMAPTWAEADAAFASWACTPTTT